MGRRVSASARHGVVAGVTSFTLLMAGCSTSPVALHPHAGPVVEAERAFAAEAARSGWVSAFKRYAAPDAIVIQPEPVSAHDSLAKLPPEANTRNLAWWPIWAGIASSGDLGFTTGPYVFADRGFGHYFTVWRKQPDGGWKWIYDGGPRSAERSPFGPETEPIVLPASHGGAGSADGAMREVGVLETALAADAAVDARSAYLRYLAVDARIMGSPAQPGVDARSRAAELEWRPARLEYGPLGGAASTAGDLVFTYGQARWTRDDGHGRGHYVRIWQMRAEGWRIVFDQLLVVPRRP